MFKLLNSNCCLLNITSFLEVVGVLELSNTFGMIIDSSFGMTIPTSIVGILGLLWRGLCCGL